MKYFLGVDQGGTKTAAAVCNEAGEVLGFGIHDGLVCTYFQDDEEIYIKNLRIACETALNEAGITFSDVTAVCGSLNGADWDFEYMILASKLMRASECQDVTVINDSMGAMRGGSLNPNCAAFCVGTGGNIAVCNETGQAFMYGYFLPENLQGGNALGRRMFAAVLEAYVGVGEPTMLTDLVLDFTGYEDVQKLYMDITLNRYEMVYKNLAELFLEACAHNDPVALNIARCFAGTAAKYILAAVKRLGLENQSLDLVFSGSVFKDNGVIITRMITEELQRTNCDFRAIDASYEPVCGTLLTLLNNEYGGRIPGRYLDNFDRTCRNYPLVRDVTVKSIERKE